LSAAFRGNIERRLDYQATLEIAANWAAILTAVVATVAYARFVFGQLRRQWALEKHLRDERAEGEDQGRRTVVHLMANLGMTEAEVLRAGFDSKKVRAVPGVDDQGRAIRLYFQSIEDEEQLMLRKI
jgi:hypothetical protein